MATLREALTATRADVRSHYAAGLAARGVVTIRSSKVKARFERSAHGAAFCDALQAALLGGRESEVISWPVTLGAMLLAFGSLIAAGLPLMLTMIGLLAAAGSLYLGTLITPISIWAMDFVLMFALALGIDYALFIVMRATAACSAPTRTPSVRRANTTRS